MGSGLHCRQRRFPAFTRLGWACLLAKARTEAMNLTRWDEDLRYRDPARILNAHGTRAVRTEKAKAEVRAHKRDTPWTPFPTALAEARELVGNPVAMGDRVYAAWGGYAGRGLGVIQNTTLDNHMGFAKDFGLSLPAARAYMLTIPGAAMTAPWYLARCKGGTAAANAGNMREVIRLVWQPGGTEAALTAIWDTIHGKQQVADFVAFRKLLGV